jgi:hypothetical protein
MKLTYADIAAHDVRLTSAEAVALVLALARELDAEHAAGSCRGVPPAEHILLNSDGRVTLKAAGPLDADDTDRVRQLAGLLRGLLGLDAPESDSSRHRVPGALLVLLARASGELDAPMPSFAQLQQGLARFTDADAATLSSLYWRCVTSERQVAVSNAAPATVLAWRGQPEPTERVLVLSAIDRRRPRSRAADFQRHFRRTKRRRLLRRVALAGGAAGCLGSGVLGGWLLALAWPNDSQTDAQVSARVALTAGVPAGSAAQTSRTTQGRADELPNETPTPITIELKEPPNRLELKESADQPEPRQVSTAPLVLAAAVGDNAFSPSFAQHGRSLLFHAGRQRGALMRASIGEAGDVRVATVLRDGAANYHAALSPDGHWMAYDSDRDGTRGVYVARSDASQPRRISGEGYAAVPSWSPDGTRLTFIKADPQRARVWNVWVADVASGALTQVSHHRVGQAWRAPWFPDGERIAYSVEDRLVIANLRTGMSRVFRSPRRGRLVRTPAVSPDGRSIVFQVHGDGAWLLDVPTATMRRVLADRSAEEFAWSPDGKQVAYHTRRNGTWSVWQASLVR